MVDLSVCPLAIALVHGASIGPQSLSFCQLIRLSTLLHICLTIYPFVRLNGLYVIKGNKAYKVRYVDRRTNALPTNRPTNRPFEQRTQPIIEVLCRTFSRTLMPKAQKSIVFPLLARIRNIISNTKVAPEPLKTDNDYASCFWYNNSNIRLANY